MEVRHFRLIEAVAESGSLTKAADKLCLTQSALSHQLRDIEGQLKVKVFVRKNKLLVLTAAGKSLLESSMIILGEIEKVRKEIGRNNDAESGTIRICTECSTCYHWLPKILRVFQQQYPKIDVRLHTGGRKPPIDLLVAGKVDIAVVYRKKIVRSVSFIDLFSDEVVALVPAGHLLASKKYLTARDFEDETYITHSDKLEKSIFYEKFLKPKGVRPRQVLHIQLTEAVLEMVEEGLGLAVMARWLIKPYIKADKIKLVSLNPSGLQRKWFVATSAKRAQAKHINDFIEELRKIDVQ